MARKGVQPTQRSAPIVANGQPPPSTIAAQIVSNAPKVSGVQTSKHKDEFKLQLGEFLRDPQIDESEPALLVDLISVVTRAGLNTLLQDDPFVLDLSHASDSLKVVSLIVLRKPHLLFEAPNSHKNDPEEPPVLLWLFPTLLGLLGQSKLESLQDHVQELLNTCLDVFRPTASLWQYASIVLDLYKACVESILNALEATETGTSASTHRVDVKLPPPSSISTFWPHSQNLVALPDGSQRQITTHAQAIAIAFTLLQSIFHYKKYPQISSNATQASASDVSLPWALDSSLYLFQTFVRSCAHLTRGPVHDTVEAGFLELLGLTTLTAKPYLVSLLDSPKAAICLCTGIQLVIRSCCDGTVAPSNQVRLALLLLQLRGLLEKGYTRTRGQDHGQPGVRALITDSLAPAILNACSHQSAFDNLEEDLRLALCLWTSDGDWPPAVFDCRVKLFDYAAESFTSEMLQNEAAALITSFDEMQVADEAPPRKRRKIDEQDDRTKHKLLYQNFVMLVNGTAEESAKVDLCGISTSIRDLYLLEDHSESDMQIKHKLEQERRRREVLSGFARLGCAGAGSLSTTEEDASHWSQRPCSYCDNPKASPGDDRPYWDVHVPEDEWKDVLAALMEVTTMPEFEQFPKDRALVALAIGRIFNHINAADHLYIEHCDLAQWLLASMSRSQREVRIAAVQSLMTFLGERIPRSIKEKNRMSVLQFFASLREKDVPYIQETLIMAYGQAARVCGEDELPIILLQLVEYLGHTNALICGMAYNELESIAEFFETKIIDLLRPYWKDIGFAVIKDLQNKPQKAQHLSDLTEQSVPNLLLATQTDILPRLVLTKRKDIVQRIATARQTSVQDVLIQPRKNLAGILALLICQPVADVEKTTMDALLAMAPGFQDSNRTLSDWVKLDPTLIACEILRTAADQHSSRREQYRRGFGILASLADAKDGQRKTVSRKKALQSFFEVHILGIMAHFSEVLSAPHANRHILEKRRCVGAIGEMVEQASNYVSLALPQVRACLQSAMADRQLCDQTFLVWIELVKALEKEEDELPFVIDQTFALVVHNWDWFSEDTKMKTNDFLLGFVKTHNRLLQERIDSIPSLASIPMFSKLESELNRLKKNIDKVRFFHAYSQRCNDENAVVVRQALKDLVPFLEENQSLLHEAAVSQKPFPALPALTRALLDACVRFAEHQDDIPVLCARSLGLIGGLDPYRVETIRETEQIVVLSNFEIAGEVIDFTAFLLEKVLVKVFHSTTNARAQGFLAYVMQELLKACGFRDVTEQMPRLSQPSAIRQRWNNISEAARSTLTPFLTSRYMIQISNTTNEKGAAYPIFTRSSSHTAWLRTFVYDLLRKGKGENAQMIFPLLARVIRGHDLSISTFILPYAVLNVIITGDEMETVSVGQELLTVLETEIQGDDHMDASAIKQCSENVFQTLDYVSLWLQEKRKTVADARVMAGRTGRGISEIDEIKSISQISCVENLLQRIPAQVISKRAVECGSYSRALYHWEQYYRQEQQKAENNPKQIFAKDNLLQRLQFIYAQIEEPDSLEGISAHLQVLNPEQQIMEHEKAGRWTAAQSWYELKLAERPTDTNIQMSLLTCLKQSGQYDSILNYVDGFHAANSYSSSILPFATEAAWSTGKWKQLERILVGTSEQASSSMDFNVGVGRALLALRQRDIATFKSILGVLQAETAKEISPTSSSSLHACHDSLIKLHALYEVETISGVSADASKEVVLENLDRRLDILGAYTSDKQYLLGLRRAVMQLSRIDFSKIDIASAWLTTARLARKSEFTSTAFNSILHAAQLGDDASKIEYSKLMWKEGHHRKAIQNLQGAIASNAFQSRETLPADISLATTTTDAQQNYNRVKCHAELLLAKWLDRAGQTHSHALKDAYAAGIMSYPRWDKGHYYLGRHYDKLLESEKTLPLSKQSMAYAAGEYVKLIVDNYIRSLVYGTKYYYQTVPKLLTLWLDLGMEVHQNPPRGAKEKSIHDLRVNYLENVNRHIKKYNNDRVPAYTWYTAFPQIITRISHPQKSVWEVLQGIITKVASQYPQQALWSLLAVTKATQDDRRSRGLTVLTKLRTDNTKRRHGAHFDLKNLIAHGQRLSDALLSACDAGVEPRVSRVSLSKDLNFNHKLAPCLLVVPIEATMIATLPTSIDSRVLRSHNPFPQDAITISSFADDVLVLSSLQRPRKVNVRGSDGRQYGLLCKPKDDLRKDQRLMEFNAMINRALQRDIECSKRRLYIKTYGVTPLNEECGTIEWVEGLKPMRDIILRLYRQKAVPIDYNELRMLLNEACSDPSKVNIFTHRILKQFQPVLYEWFIETFPEPEAWFAARLRYTRSCAVMSIVGHVLGLGDRHGENVLLEEGNGGTFHVDFNCLFDKGLTFEKPELVPFRLTHNMVDAMGPQGIEGPFRTAAEQTYKQLRQHEETLITILETFVHDPTADFLGGKRRKKIANVPETPQEVLESVRRKVTGYVIGDTVPLSVEGYVETQIEAARNPKNLASMYIGWCAFF